MTATPVRAWMGHLREALLPRVDLITPNLPEAADLLGEAQTHDVAGMSSQARRLGVLGASRVPYKGGHLAGDHSTDVLLADGCTHVLSSERVNTTNDHGTGCTLSAAIVALRPRHSDWVGAVHAAKSYLTAALAAADALDVGRGRGPVHHFYPLWPSPEQAAT